MLVPIFLQLQVRDDAIALGPAERWPILRADSRVNLRQLCTGSVLLEFLEALSGRRIKLKMKDRHKTETIRRELNLANREITHERNDDGPPREEHEARPPAEWRE